MLEAEAKLQPVPGSFYYVCPNLRPDFFRFYVKDIEKMRKIPEKTEKT
ncbi:MAG: hypothetical protein Q4F29_02595 [Lachnospiraceae bacterium]|nr:hypothetical protein [Lachnospiraceae bacterium]